MQSEHVGAKDRSADSVLQKSIRIDEDKINYFMQKYLNSGKNQEANLHSEKQKKLHHQAKQKKEYEKRKDKANEKKREYLYNKSLHAEH